MEKQTRKQLLQTLSTLDSNERNKLYKRASTLRKIQSQKVSRRLRAEDECPRRAKSLEDFVLDILAAESDVDTSAAAGVGQVVWLGRTSCRLQAETLIECALNPAAPVAVGDRASYARFGDGWKVAGVLPRTSVLSKPDSFDSHRERVIAANVDFVLIVVSFVTPPLHPRIIDRYFIAVSRGGARPILCVNKRDLLTEANASFERAKLQPYRSLMPVIEVSTLGGEGVSELESFIRGSTVVLVGHSGVGKSSIANAIEPGLGILCGEVSEGYGRGTHTTTASTLHTLHDGTRVIDTPGVRAFGLWEVDASTLEWYFPEFAEPGLRCKFRDCGHTHEPSCGVRSAVERGEIDRARYDTYLRLRDSP